MATLIDLHALIHTLSRTEKRYFKLFVQRFRKANVPLKFYQALSEMPSLEEGLPETLLQELFMRQPGVARLGLQEKLLESLRAYHQGWNVGSRLREGLDLIELMEKKGNPGLLKAMLKKTWKEAEKYERPLEMMALLQWQMREVKRLKPSKMAAERAHWGEIQRQVAEEIAGESELRLLHDEVFEMVRSQGSKAGAHFSTRLAEIETLPVLTDQGPRYFDARNIRGHLRGWIAVARGDFAQAREALGELISMWEAHPHQLKERRLAFVSLLFTYLDYAYQAREWVDFEAKLARMRSVKPENRSMQSRIFTLSAHLELLYMMEFPATAQTWKRVNRIAEELSSLSSILGKSGELTFLHNIANLCFHHREYRRALPWINRVLSYPRTAARRDLQTAALLFQLVAHYELGNHELLESLIRSARRHFQVQPPSSFTEALLREFPKLLSSPVPAERKAIFQQISAAGPGTGLEAEVYQWIQQQADA